MYKPLDSSIERVKSKAETMEQPLVMRKRSLTLDHPDGTIQSENKVYNMSNRIESSAMKHEKYAKIIVSLFSHLTQFIEEE